VVQWIPGLLVGSMHCATPLPSPCACATPSHSLPQCHVDLPSPCSFTPCSLKDWKQLELFEREAQILASLTHRGIPQYLEYFEDDSEADRAFFLVQVSARAGSCRRQLVRGVGSGPGAQHLLQEWVS
jgi:serine/threonine protein kinase